MDEKLLEIWAYSDRFEHEEYKCILNDIIEQLEKQNKIHIDTDDEYTLANAIIQKINALIESSQEQAKTVREISYHLRNMLEKIDANIHLFNALTNRVDRSRRILPAWLENNNPIRLTNIQAKLVISITNKNEQSKFVITEKIQILLTQAQINTFNKEFPDLALYLFFCKEASLNDDQLKTAEALHFKFEGKGRKNYLTYLDSFYNILDPEQKKKFELYYRNLFLLYKFLKQYPRLEKSFLENKFREHNINNLICKIRDGLPPASSASLIKALDELLETISSASEASGSSTSSSSTHLNSDKDSFSSINSSEEQDVFSDDYFFQLITNKFDKFADKIQLHHIYTKEKKVAG